MTLMTIQDHSHPALTADVVLLAVGLDDLEVLLIRRDAPPFQDAWAFPGGFVEVGESPEETARRELAEETSMRGVRLEQLSAFGDPGRDPRGRVVTVAFMGVVPSDVSHPVEAGSDAAQARWWSVEDLPRLAFDHDCILTCALNRLRQELAWLLEDTGLMPETLTLAELRTAGGIVSRVLHDKTTAS